MRRKQNADDAENTVKENFGGADEAEAHAKAQKAARVGDVRRLGDLLVLLEALGVGIFDEDVKHDEIFPGVVQDDVFQRALSGVAIGDQLSPRDVPLVVAAKFDARFRKRFQRFQQLAEGRIFPKQRLPLWTVALLNQPPEKTQH